LKSSKKNQQLWCQILNNRNKRKRTIISNIEQQQQTKSNYNTIISNIEQEEQTKTNYNTKYWITGTNKNQLQYTKYWTTETNKNQLQYQIVNSSNKQKPTIISNIKGQEQTKPNYDTKYWTAATTKIQL
jgi:Rad3-related DNA helicase